MKRSAQPGGEPSAVAIPAPSEDPLSSLYRRWRKPLVHMLGRYFKTAADIEDASQEVFARMATVSRTLSLEDERPYLAQVARSVAAFWQRKAPGPAGLQVLSLEDCREEAEAQPAQGGGDAATHAEQRQRLVRLRDALRELPERQREAFVLHRIEELTLPETARRMGITERMVSRHLARAMAYCELRVRCSSREQMRQFTGATADASAADAPAGGPPR